MDCFVPRNDGAMDCFVPRNDGLFPVIASEARQSMPVHHTHMDCFVPRNDGKKVPRNDGAMDCFVPRNDGEKVPRNDGGTVPRNDQMSVIASEARQSMPVHHTHMDCFVPRNDGEKVPRHDVAIQRVGRYWVFVVCCIAWTSKFKPRERKMDETRLKDWSRRAWVAASAAAVVPLAVEHYSWLSVRAYSQPRYL